MNATTISARWDPHPNSNCIPNLMYFVTIFDAEEDLFESVNITDVSYTFDNLNNKTNYTIEVRAAFGNTNGSICSFNTATQQGLLFFHM